jgi:hypothetical protein
MSCDRHLVGEAAAGNHFVNQINRFKARSKAKHGTQDALEGTRAGFMQFSAALW